MTGEGNHRYCQNAVSIQPCTITGTIYDTGWGFPAFRPEGSNTVHAELIEILNELRSIKIPLMPQEMAGCDGTFYTLIVGSCFGGATYSCWSQPPTGWEILPKVTRQIIDEFSRNCRNKVVI